MAEKNLVPIEQREVELYDDELIAIRANDGKIYVSVRHLCDALGLSRPSQVNRINRNEILAEGYKGGFIMTPPSYNTRPGQPNKPGRKIYRSRYGWA